MTSEGGLRLALIVVLTTSLLAVMGLSMLLQPGECPAQPSEVEVLFMGCER